MGSLITLSLVGLLVGFIFSMPIAGPISILITSKALDGKVRYCNLAALGASVADFIYVFCAVFGLTKFYSFLKPAIPYMLFVGMIFLLVLGYKISKTRIDLKHINDNNKLPQIKKEMNGFLAGFLLNFLNPTLFFGWLTSSFIVISLLSSLGFSTDGLDQRVDKSFNAINKKGEGTALRNKTLSYLHLDSVKAVKPDLSNQGYSKASKYFSFLSSILYAFFLSAGGVLWFFYLAFILAKNRHKVNIKVINIVIRSLGWALYLFGIFLGYHAVSLLSS
jgi:threonine/homoserine/homoserine lactone efflux protein